MIYGRNSIDSSCFYIGYFSMDSQIKKPIRTSPYSTFSGVAAEDLDSNSIILKIICPELLPNTSFGTVGAGITEGSISLQDRDGNPIETPITTSNHLVATWEGNSNSRYPPRVRKGEPVEVFKIGNQDKFYWRTTGRGREFRTTDRVYLEVAAIDPTKPGATKDDTNTYSAFLDSENQRVGIKTSKANKEAIAFSMEADLKAGTFHISDDSEDPGNRVFLDTGAVSGVPAFHVNLISGTTFKMEGDNIFVKVPGKYVIDVGDRFVINSPIIVFNLEKVGDFIINTANVAINTSKDFIITAANVVGINSISTKISGMLIAASLRTATAIKASAGSNYEPITISRPQESSVEGGSNNADTDLSGLSYRTQ